MLLNKCFAFYFAIDYYFPCVFKILFLYACIMNITQKCYSKIHLNVLALIFFFIYCQILCTLVLLLLIKYSFHAKVCLVCDRFKDYFKMKLLKTLLRTQLKQTNLENWFHILTESPKEGFDDTVFQYLIDELKHCNLDMWMDLQPGSVLLCLYSIYLVVVLSFRLILFCFFSLWICNTL